MSSLPIEKLMDSVEWQELPPVEDDGSGLPYATHEGVFRVGTFEFKCVQLNTGERLITEQSLLEFFGCLLQDKAATKVPHTAP